LQYAKFPIIHFTLFSVHHAAEQQTVNKQCYVFFYYLKAACCD